MKNDSIDDCIYKNCINKVPLSELERRLERFRDILDEKEPGWEMALVISKINLYYFTGTMQEGLLFIPRNGDAVFYVRRSFERAVEESLFPCIRQMESYREAAAALGRLPGTAHIEAEVIPLAMSERLKKYFGFTSLKSLDACISRARSVKSPYELKIMTKAGNIHRTVMEERVPSLFREGMTESELTAAIFSVLVAEGHQGIARFSMFDTEILLGHIAFGESSLYPTYFNGPGGNYGLGPAMQLMGNRERRLRDGDLIFIDTGCGYEGYQSDKTMTYVFGKPLPKQAQEIHKKCLDIQFKMAAMLKPGDTPSNIYNNIMKDINDDYLPNFMGYGNRRVKFLGHAIGLQVDELPVLAKGFDEPLQEGMVFALEPKAGVEGVGMVGIENTFIVTAGGGRCITGDHPGLMQV
ncbi:MAG TPA: Xaa-Pro peptidase family protein [Clostridia bacterium]|nr:Xaa-Pro peptidase family protein [Clostridia bacterium]